MEQTSQVIIWDREAEQAVEATFLPEMTPDEVAQANARWMPFVGAVRERVKRGELSSEDVPQHLHWNWGKKASYAAGFQCYRTMGVVFDGVIQGMILVAIDTHTCRLAGQRGKPLIYIHFFSTAPWNDPSMQPDPRYSGVGLVLFRAAVQLSDEYDFRGRVGLHSLRQSEAFYQKMGLADLGADPSCQNLRYFELSEDRAAALLREDDDR